MNDNSTIVQILIIFLVLIVVGGNLGLSLQGTIGIEDVPIEERPGVVGIDIPFYEGEKYIAVSEDETGFLSWLWRGVAFFFSLIVFMVPDMPPWISAIFMAMTLFLLWIGAKWVRGTGGT